MVHCKQGLVSVLAIVLVHANLYHFCSPLPGLERVAGRTTSIIVGPTIGKFRNPARCDNISV